MKKLSNDFIPKPFLGTCDAMESIGEKKIYFNLKVLKNSVTKMIDVKSFLDNLNQKI